MASGKGHQDSVVSLFDLLFSGAKKNKPPKPVKLGGAAPSDVMAAGFAEVLTNPVVYASDALLTPIAEAADAMEFGRVTLHKKYNIKSKVTLKNASGFVLNPTAGVDKMYKNLEAALAKSRAEKIGGAVDAALGMAWAVKNGIPKKDAIFTGIAMSDPGSFADDPRSNLYIAHVLGKNASLRVREGGVALSKKQQSQLENGLRKMFSSNKVQNELRAIRNKHISRLKPNLSKADRDQIQAEMNSEMQSVLQDRIISIGQKLGLKTDQLQRTANAVISNEGAVFMSAAAAGSLIDTLGDAGYRKLQAKQHLLQAREKRAQAKAAKTEKESKKLMKQAKSHQKAAAAVMAWAGVNNAYESNTALPQKLGAQSASIDELISELDPTADAEKIKQLRKLKADIDKANEKYITEVFGKGAVERGIFADWRAGAAFNANVPISHKAERLKREAYKKKLEADLIKARHYTARMEENRETMDTKESALDKFNKDKESLDQEIEQLQKEIERRRGSGSSFGAWASLTDQLSKKLRAREDLTGQISTLAKELKKHRDDQKKLLEKFDALELGNAEEFEDMFALKMGAMALMPGNRSQRFAGLFKTRMKGIKAYQDFKKWTDPQLMKKWMTGDIFDDADKTAPGHLRDVVIYDGRGRKITTKVILPNEIGNNRFQVGWKKAMVGGYYRLSPIAISKTWFADGSGFRYSQAQIQSRLSRSLFAYGDFRDELTGFLSDEENFVSILGDNIDEENDPLVKNGVYVKGEDGKWRVDTSKLGEFLKSDANLKELLRLHGMGIMERLQDSDNAVVRAWAKSNRKLFKKIQHKEWLFMITKWTTRLPHTLMSLGKQGRDWVRDQAFNLLDKISKGKFKKSKLGTLLQGGLDLNTLQHMITRKIVEYVVSAVASVIPVIGTAVGYLVGKLLAPLIDKIVGKSVKEAAKIWMFLMAAFPLLLCFCIVTVFNPEKENTDPFTSVLPQKGLDPADPLDISSCPLHVVQQGDPPAADYCSLQRMIMTESNPYLNISGPGALSFFPQPGDEKSHLQFTVDVIDGATLLLYGKYVPLNPAQKKRGASDPSDMARGCLTPFVKVLRLPPTADPNGDWSDATILDLGRGPTYFDRDVSPGYYKIAVGDVCFSGSTSDVIDLTKAGSEYCGRTISNSDMPSFKSGVITDSCGLGIEYPNYLNNSCGGHMGSCEGGNCDVWHNLSLPYKDLYESVFHRQFTVPSGEYSCGKLFPSVHYEVPCSTSCGVEPEVFGKCPVTAGTVRQDSCGTYSHQRNHGTDISTDSVFKAPANGTIVRVGKNVKCDANDPNSSQFRRGGEIVFEDLNGNRYTIMHIEVEKSILDQCGVYRIGQKRDCRMPIKRGTVLGIRQETGIRSMIGGIQNPCWTGPHYHVDIKNSNGQYVDSTQALRDLGCPFH